MQSLMGSQSVAEVSKVASSGVSPEARDDRPVVGTGVETTAGASLGVSPSEALPPQDRAASLLTFDLEQGVGFRG
jgi:hypothetical protein